MRSEHVCAGVSGGARALLLLRRRGLFLHLRHERVASCSLVLDLRNGLLEPRDALGRVLDLAEVVEEHRLLRWRRG